MGEPVAIVVAGAMNALADDVVFDGQTAASEIWLIGEEGASVETGLIRVGPGAPAIHIWSLHLSGTVQVDGGNIEMVNTTLSAGRRHRALEATSSAQGAAPLLRILGGSMRVHRSTVENGLGGAIWLSGGRLALLDCHLRGNGAARGGALRVDGNGHAIVEGTFFEDNLATESGGAVHAGGGVIELLNRTLFERNRSPSGKSLHIMSEAKVTYKLVSQSA